MISKKTMIQFPLSTTLNALECGPACTVADPSASLSVPSTASTRPPQNPRMGLQYDDVIRRAHVSRKQRATASISVLEQILGC